MNEEELLVLLEFSDKSEATYCGEYSNNFEILEIESSKPIVKIGQRLYSGEYQNNIGTYLFFSDSATTSSDSNEFNYKDKPIKNTHTTRPKVSKDRSIPLTYEQTQFAHLIGETKTWNSWNTSNLLDGKRQAESCYDDLLIRKFIAGTWQDILASEIIIKRKFNQINIIFQISKRRRLNPRQIYFLTGYSEELLSYLLKCVVKIEFQSVDHKDDLIFRYW